MPIEFEDFKKTEIRIGEILAATRVPETDKLLQLRVSFGLGAEGATEERQIISGIAAYFPEPEVLVGKKCAFVTNLVPRVIRGLESQGMILAAKSGEAFSLLEVARTVAAGTVIG